MPSTAIQSDSLVYAGGSATFVESAPSTKQVATLAPAAAASTVDVDQIQWSEDTDVRLYPGDYVRAFVELTIELPYADEKTGEYSRYLAALESHPEHFEELWNKKLAEKGESTRMKIVALRKSRWIARPNPTTFIIEVEVIARVVHNSAIITWVVVSLIAVAWATYTADALWNDGRIAECHAKAAGTFVQEVVGGVTKPAGRDILVPLAVIGAVLWGMKR